MLGTDKTAGTGSMEFRYLRHRVFQRMRAPISDRARRKRMDKFLRIMNPQPHCKIIDIGGTISFWDEIPETLDIAVVNLPGSLEDATDTHHHCTIIEGDGCDLAQFLDREFEIAFSNSVIEHVGPRVRQEAFAKEVRRLGHRYWVQTPSLWFPIEAHTGMPFWWFYGSPMRSWIIKRWYRKLPAWSDMVAGTRLLSKARMTELFPEARIATERMFGFPKSYIAYCKPASHEP